MASFKQAFLSKDFVYCAELPLAPDSTAESIVDDATVLARTPGPKCMAAGRQYVLDALGAVGPRPSCPTALLPHVKT